MTGAATDVPSCSAPVRRGLPQILADRGLVDVFLVLAVLLVYLPGILGGAFHFDDGHSIVDNAGVRDLANVPRFFVDPTLWSGEPGNAMYRPVLLVTYAVDHALWGYRSAGWLLTNALLHALGAVLVHRLARRIGLSDLASVLAGVVFAVHPVSSEVVNYVSSRSESVAAVLFLGALHLHLAGRAASGARAVAWFAAAFVVSFAAMLSKETATTFCVAVFFLEICRWRAPWWERVARAVGFGFLYALALAGFLLLRQDMLGHATAPVALVSAAATDDPQVGGGRSILDNLVTQSRAVVLYVQILLWPVRLSVDHDVRIVQLRTLVADPAFGSVLAAIALHASIVVGAVVAAFRGRRLFPLTVAWFWWLLAPSIGYPLNVVMNEHRLYLPGIAVALLAGACLARVAELLRGVRGVTAALAPLALFVALAVHRTLEWADDEDLWRTAVERSPKSARAHMHLGAVHHEHSRRVDDEAERVRLLDLALASYEESEKLHPGWYDLWFDIGHACLDRGRITHDKTDLHRALEAYRRCGGIVGETAMRPRYWQAVALMELGRSDESAALLRQLRSEDSSVTTMYDYALAQVLRKSGDRAGAAAAMERVIAIEEPLDRIDGLLELGWWYFEDRELTKAESYISRALTIGNRIRDFRPQLYVARFLRLLGQSGAEQHERNAMTMGWTAEPDEVEWVRGGPTPGVSRGTVGGRR